MKYRWEDFFRFLILCTRSDLMDSDQEWMRRFSSTQPPWEHIAAMAEMQGVAGFFRKILKEANPLPPMPDTVITRLDQCHLRNVRQRFIYTDAIRRISTAVAGEGLRLMALQGASLFDLYPEMGLRHLSDLDLLIDPRQSKAIGRVLTDLGYRTPDSVYPYLFEKGTVRIDLHMHPLNLDRIRRRRLLFPEAVGALWHRSARVEEENGALRVPDPFDNIVLLCAHAMKHGYGLLIWLVDLRELLNRLRHRPDGWQTIRRRALEWRQTRSVGYGLRLALALNDEDGSTVMEEQGFPPLGRLENRLLEMKRCGWHSKLLGLWLGGLSLEHRVNTLPLIWESAFPNPAVMEQIRRDKGDQWGALRRAVSGLCCAGEDLSAFFSSRFR
jgi:hypothetical protein